MLDTLRAELAPTGVLRAAINLSNFLLVRGQTPSGDPIGPSPDMARAVAERLGVPVQYICYPNPGALADDATEKAWDIGNIGAEPERAKTIAFTAAYAEIEATYLVPKDSPIQTIGDVDCKGMRIGVYGRSAYGLWLADNLAHAELVKADSVDASFDSFVEQGLDALAGLRPRLINDAEHLPGSRLLEGQFTAVQQAIGTSPKRTTSIAVIRPSGELDKAATFVATAIARVDIPKVTAPLVCRARCQLFAVTKSSTLVSNLS